MTESLGKKRDEITVSRLSSCLDFEKETARRKESELESALNSSEHGKVLLAMSHCKHPI